MSVDLTLVGSGTMESSEYMASLRCHGETLLGRTLPEIELYEVVGGRRVSETPLVGQPETMLILSWLGTEDAVAVVSVTESAKTVSTTFAVGATRTPTEYVLAMLGAFALGQAWGAIVRDDAHYWSDSDVLRPEVVQKICAGVSSLEFGQACEQIVGRLAEQ